MIRERIKFWGAPGCGKTDRLIGIVNDELDHGTRPDDMIYTSFTRAACKEAMQRALNSEAGMFYEKGDFPWFRTEHAICYKLLGLKKDQVFAGKNQQEFIDKYPAYSVSRITLEADLEIREHTAILQTLGDYYEFFILWMHNMMLPFDNAMQQFRRNQIELPDEFTPSGARTYMERRETFKKERGLLDFHDMIRMVTELKACPPNIKVLIGDELQDCNASLYKLLEMWAAQVERVYVAGDPLQSIFRWSGSSPELFDEFPGELEVLPHSHRLPPQIKDYAEKIIALANLPFPKFTAADKVGEITYNGHVNKIDWLNLGPTFLLARTHWQLYRLSKELKQMGVPYTAGERQRIWTPLESSKGEAYLTLIKLHAREKVNADDLRALAKHTREPWLLRGAKTRIKELAQAEYSFKEIAHFFKPDFLSVIAEDFAPVLCKDIEEDDRSYLHRVYKKCGVSAFLKQPDIVLSTIHGSKGREKETVVISQELGKKVYDSFLKDKQSEVFVAYVAATRSMKRIIMLQRETPESFPYPRMNGAEKEEKTK